MQRFSRILGLLAIAGATAFGQLAAQNPSMPPDHPGMAGMGNHPGMQGAPGAMHQEMQGMMAEMQGMMHDMMGIQMYAPAMLLDRKADLGLTAAQVKQIQALSDEVRIAKDHARTEHDTRHARIMEQFKLAKPDPAKVKADAQEAMNDMAAAHGIEVSAAARAKGLLTDAQRAKVDKMIEEHQKGAMQGGAGEHQH